MSVRIPLPFGSDVNSEVLQGFGLELAPSETGTPTHQGTPEYYYAIDFPMARNTPVLSQGNGEVIAMRENLHEGEEPNSIGNFVTVRYDEGFVATYQHLRQDGVEVEAAGPNSSGRVIPHQLLGYSGNTGFSEGPHLHVTYGEQSVDWGAGHVIADGSQAANHNTSPVLFATPEDTPEDIDGWGILNPGTSYRGDNIENTVGGSGNDVLIGRANNSELRGGSGHDLLLAAAGNDTLFGEDGNDALSGGPGNDTLDGGAGNDVMTGGPGADQFTVLGDDKIVDFNPKEDSIWLPGPVNGTSIGNDTAVTYPGGTLTLVNTKPTDVPGLSSERLFSETEPNNSDEQANDLGKLFPNQKIHITGHVNGQTDPFDYFDYTTTVPGTVHEQITMKGENVYDNTFTTQGDEPRWIEAHATGNFDSDHDTYIDYQFIA